MKTLKPKLLLIILFAIGILFFSNDFGLIDIEKTAIITAIAIDKADDGDYLVTCQIAVPEASNSVSENQKAQISGKGGTVATALKSTGSTSGWFPQTIFCNLIIVGNDLTQDNVITVLDYFSKTMRVQDSAQVVLAEKKAKELLDSTSPLDNISSFAIQKILLKNPGFDQDVCAVDIKTFCVGYYSSNASSYMPIVKIKSPTLSQDNSSSGQGELSQGSSNESKTNGSGGSGGSGSSSGSSGGVSDNSGNKTSGKALFDATSTALFVKGVKVGELDKNLTHTFNVLTKQINGSAFEINNVDGKNYLLTVLKDDSIIQVCADTNKLDVNIDVKLFCKISDQNTQGSNNAFDNTNPIPERVRLHAQNQIEQSINELIATSKNTGCDFLNLKQKLYRFNFEQYSNYKDNFFDKMNLNIKVSIKGQR